MRASVKNYRQSPRKVRLVADLIRGKSVERAQVLLSFLEKRAALPMKKLLDSAVSNAKQLGKDPKNLKVGTVMVDEGITFKRLEYRARGSANILKKRTSHVQIALSEAEDAQETKTEVVKEVQNKAEAAR